MAHKALPLAALLALAGVAAGLRTLGRTDESRTGRQLLDSTFDPSRGSKRVPPSDYETQTAEGRKLLQDTPLYQVFVKPSTGTPYEDCLFNNTPGNSALGRSEFDRGPLSYDVTATDSPYYRAPLTVTLVAANYGSGGQSILPKSITGDTAHFNAPGGNQAGQSFAITYNPVTGGQSVNYFGYVVDSQLTPLCGISITFNSKSPQFSPPSSPTPPPSPPAPGSPTPTPTPAPTTPPGADACTSGPPCYCQPDGSYCFNNGATLTTTCTRPTNVTCVGAAIDPATLGAGYAGYPKPVNVCKCSPATSG